MLGNLTDFDPDRHRLARRQLPELDRWALARYDELAARIVKAFERFEFHAVYQGLNYFCGTTMSAFYLDIIKDRLYASGSDSLPRRAAQTALYEILHGMLRLMSPILSLPRPRPGSPCTVSPTARRSPPAYSSPSSRWSTPSLSTRGWSSAGCN